jgi:hypothetical protein
MNDPSRSFRRQPDDTPVSEVALRLVVEPLDGDPEIVGTATIVAGHLAITARHVLEDIVSRFGARQVIGNPGGSSVVS